MVGQLLDGCARGSITATEINDALVAAAYGGSVPVTRLLLDRGYGVDAKDEHGRTALMGAAVTGEVAVAQLLIAAGADVNVRDSTGGAALHRAVEFGTPTMAEMLLKHGADRRIRTQEGVSAWDLAVNSKNAKLIALFRRDAEAAAKGSLPIKRSQ